MLNNFTCAVTVCGVFAAAAFFAPTTGAAQGANTNTGVSYEAGNEFKDCSNCPVMVVIPPGEFRMGDISGGGQKIENPVHPVTINYRFAAGKFELTLGEYRACVADGGCRNTIYSDTTPSGDTYPMLGLMWADAAAYVAWLREKTGKPYRLLSEAEWEYVARAGSDDMYTFGNDLADLCNYGNGAAENDLFAWRNKDCSDGSSPKEGGIVGVGNYLPNAFGAYDMHGNVWEWVEDCGHLSYDGAPADGSPWVTDSKCVERVLRGGSAFDDPKSLRSSHRLLGLADVGDGYYGLRVALTLSP